jgi:tetratricopeptide (TPR) repeat protein/tRNA A-37 threonylcarbamoyl transferase component Bud32
MNPAKALEAPSPCPDRVTLLDFRVGKLPAAQRESIAAHLDGCGRCLAVLEEQRDDSDSLLAGLRQPLPPGVVLGLASPAPPAQAPATPLTSGSTDPGGVSAGPTASPDLSPSAQNRYEPEGFHARGGLGEVLVARDRELGRKVALKRIRAERVSDEDSRRRFLLEAEITSKLEHPGVVPVYGLVQGTGGDPCYAMRFIQGDSLKDAIEHFHAADRPGRDPGERSLALRQLLGRFVAVCNTIAYAHSRGIIHRDLKPANVMLGKYGETLVVDWGLAKQVARTEAERSSGEETLAPSSGSSSEGGTEMGQAVGTPAYMSPEQAEGNWGEVGPASDIFSLGATLYQLLTGQAPFQGGNPKEVLAKARRGEFPPPRQVKPAVPQALEAICQKALALKPEARYATPRALADDVEHWLADEPVGAWQEPWTGRARRWVRRNRTLATAAATTVLLAVLTGGVVYALVQQHQREQQEQTDRVVNQALGQAKALRDQARAIPPGDLAQLERSASLWRDALAAAERADMALASGDARAETRQHVAQLLAELRAESAEAGKDRDMLRRLEEARERSMELQESDYVRLQGVRGVVFGLAAASAYADAFRKYGIDVETLSTDEAVRRIRQRPIRVQLTAALDDWHFTDPRAARGRLLQVSGKADHDRLRSRVRLAMAGKDWKALKRLAESEHGVDLPPPTLILLAEVLHHEGMRAEALQLMKRGQRKYPRDFWVNDALGIYLTTADVPDFSGACRCFAAAIALRPHSAVVRCNLGSTLTAEGELDAAVSVLRESIRLHPNFALSYAQLATALVQKGEADQALDVVRKALQRHPGSPMLLTSLGNTLNALGKQQEAIDAFRSALRRNPGWIEARLALATVLAATGQAGEAEKHIDQVQRSHPRLTWVCLYQAYVLQSKGDVDGALRAYRKALQGHPWVPWAWSSFGLAQLQLQLPHNEALLAFRRAARMAPRNGSIRTQLALGLTLLGRLEEAEATAREAIHLNPGNPIAYQALYLALAKQKNYQEAEAVIRKAIRLQPHYTSHHHSLGGVLTLQKKFPEAITACNEAIRRDPKQGLFRDGLGNAYLAQRRYAEAVAHYREAIRLSPRNALLHANLSNALREKGDVAQAIAELRKAVTLMPKSGSIARSIQCGLALALRKAGKYEEAIQAGREAVRLEGGSDLAHNTLALALEAAGKLDEAIAEYREAVRLAPTDSRMHNNLGYALWEKKRYAEALASFREAIHLEPGKALYHYWLGEVFFSEKKYAKAARAYHKAAELEPGSANHYTALAITYDRAHDYQRAEAAARKAIEIDPKRWQGHNALGIVFSNQGRYAEAIPHFNEAIRLSQKIAVLHENLGDALRLKGDFKDAIAELSTAAALNPNSGSIQWKLARALRRGKQFDEAIQAGQKAVQLDSRSSLTHNALALALASKGKLDEAITEYREAARLEPNNALNHSNLGNALWRKKQYAEAIVSFRDAIHLSPEKAIYRKDLGDALFAEKKYAEAAAAYGKAVQLEPGNARFPIDLADAYYRDRKYQQAEAAARMAIKIDPKQSGGYNELGMALDGQRRFDEAVKQYRQAIALHRDNAVLLYNLGNTLLKQHKDAEAEAEFRKAMSLKPQYVSPRVHLAILLMKKGNAAGAEAELRQAVKLAPEDSLVHGRLSQALVMQGKNEEAVVAARRTVQLDPSDARAHFRLGDALLGQGVFAQALASFHQANRLRTPEDDGFDPLPWEERIRDSTRSLQLDATLAGVRQGKLKVLDPAEQAALGRFCHQRKNRPRTAVRFYRNAFAGDEKLADDLSAGHRFSAACAAALAGAGKGKDAGKIDARERARLRRQSLAWLKADLAAWAKRLGSGQQSARAAVQEALQRWLRDPDLSSLRDGAALAKLPKAEREACRKLWTEVAALLKRARPR